MCSPTNPTSYSKANAASDSKSNAASHSKSNAASYSKSNWTDNPCTIPFTYEYSNDPIT